MEEGHITDKRGRKLKTFSWKPDGDVKGLVFLSHGSVFDVLLIFLRLITSLRPQLCRAPGTLLF